MEDPFALEMSGSLDPGRPKRPIATRFTSLDANKLRGGYYTAPEIAHWLCQWAIRDSHDNVLEPSCGDGVFLEAAALRLEALGATAQAIQQQLVGVEIVDIEAQKARARLAAIPGASGLTSCVVNRDFFEWSDSPARPPVKTVIGNPPFIRYQACHLPAHRSQRVFSI